MLETPGGFAQVCNYNGRAEYLCRTKGMSRRRLPTGKTVAAFLARTIVLDDERVVLREVGALYIRALPAAGASIGAPQLPWRGAKDGDASLLHCRAVGLDFIGGKHKIEIALAFRQLFEHARLCFFRSTYCNQFDIGVADHNNAIGSTAGGMDTSARYCQSKFLAE